MAKGKSVTAYLYKACFMADIAKRAGYDDLQSFQGLLTPADFHAMVDLGWLYYKKLISPPVVKYLMDKFCPDYDQSIPATKK